jgi:hypothetical protein
MFHGGFKAAALTNADRDVVEIISETVIMGPLEYSSLCSNEEAADAEIGHWNVNGQTATIATEGSSRQAGRQVQPDEF